MHDIHDKQGLRSKRGTGRAHEQNLNHPYPRNQKYQCNEDGCEPLSLVDDTGWKAVRHSHTNAHEPFRR